MEPILDLAVALRAAPFGPACKEAMVHTIKQNIWQLDILAMFSKLELGVKTIQSC